MTRLFVSSTVAIVAAAGSLACTAQVYGRASAPPPPPPPTLFIHADVGASAGVQATAYAEPNPDVPDTSVFYQPLAAYGMWTTVEPHGQVWVPRVPPDWRPYSDGHWTYTEVGWTWVSNEPFGWATFHYGRWYRDPRYDWVWVPGTQWGPAWVAWRHGGHEIGWAPLPPRARWRAGIGFEVSPVIVEAEIGPGAWHFVHTRHIDRRDVRRYYEPRERNVTIIHNTRNVTNYRVVNNRIVDNSVDVREVERVRGAPVRRMRLVDRPDPGRSEVRVNNEVAVYVPPQARHRRVERGRPGPNRAVTAPIPPSRQGQFQRERDRQRQMQAERAARQARQDAANAARQRQQMQAERARQARQDEAAAARQRQMQVERARQARQQEAAAARQRQQAQQRASAARQQQREQRRAAASEPRQRPEARRPPAPSDNRGQQRAAPGERRRPEARAPGRPSPEDRSTRPQNRQERRRQPEGRAR